MEADDGVVFLRKIEPGWAEEVLKACGGNDLRYATGIADNEPHAAIMDKLMDKPAFKNRFASCIFATDTRNRQDEAVGNLAGLVMGTLYNETLWIRIFIIIPRYRRKGIGSRAARLIFQRGKEVYGATEAMLSVAGENRAGFSFWAGQGFTEACRFYKPLFGDGQLHRVTILRKTL
ncbi:MAG: N-acetyltransferase family protein [Bacillota bacterium]